MFLKLLCGLTLLCGLALAAPPQLGDLQAAKKRVERNKRGLIPGSVEESKLDIENYAPLDIVEKSLEKNDGEGDNEINGTKKIDDKDIEYYHKKNQGTVKTIVEEKARDGNKLENVFYHLSYEKAQDSESTPAPLWDTTVDTTDQTLPDDYTTLAEDEETNDDDEDTSPVKPEYIHKIADLFAQDKEPLTDATVPSEETFNTDSPNSNEQDPNPIDQDSVPRAAGWFNNWFGPGNPTNDDIASTTSLPALGDTPHLDRAIYSQFTILSPFYFGSVRLRAPSCPAHRPNLITIYFFSFCV